MSAVHPPHSLPLSPSSPPESGLRRQKRRLSDDNLPDSPNSPPLMSVTANGHVSQYGNARQGTSDPAQGGSVDMQRQRSATALPTPANSVAGSMKAGDIDDMDQHRDKRQRLDPEEREIDDQEVLGVRKQPTNHDRQLAVGSSDVEGSASTTRAEPKYGLFLVQTKHAKAKRLQPDPSSHLMSVYGLNSILKNVSRHDPATGEKINPMRKSYEGQIKSFELAGINKSVKKELELPFNPGRLMTMYRSPADQLGFDIDASLKQKLQNAMQMQPGKVRNHDEWEKLLGHEKPRFPPPQPVQTIQPVAPVRANGVARPQIVKISSDRSRRPGKRRKYDDSSFEGYADGFLGEDLTDSEDDGGSAKKRRRRTDYDEE